MTLEQQYQGHGIIFRYPSGWELTEEARDDAHTVTVSEIGAFWCVTVLKRRPRAADVLEQACEAFRQEYDEIDIYPGRQVTLAGKEVDAQDLEFVALELVNCVSLRAFEHGGRTIFVMSQMTDHERDTYADVFQEISESLQCDSDENILIN